MELTLGHIDYLNCVPFFHYLRDCGFQGTVQKGVPAQLNQMLAEGDVDVSPSSSFEYARNVDKYRLLPGHSISAFSKVQSVILFSRKNIDEVKNSQIYLTGESATSVHLLKVLLREFYAWDHVEGIVPQQPAEELVEQGYPVLLIGDKALKYRAKLLNSDWHCYDLAQQWASFTGLPFVFALWIARRDIDEDKKAALYALVDQLHCARKKAADNLSILAEQQAHCPWIPAHELMDYWNAMSYDLEESHLKGLELFFTLCCKYGYLRHKPEVCFV